LANIAFAFGTLPWMPEQIPIHPGLMPPIVYAFLVSFIAVLIGAFTLLGYKFAKHFPELCLDGIIHFYSLFVKPFSKRINMPNSEYWLNEENRPKTVRRFCSYAEFIGVVSMLYLLFLQWEIFKALLTGGAPRQTGNLVIGDAVIWGLPILVTVWMMWLFRMPKEKE
jgi:hypothetical protein